MVSENLRTPKQLSSRNRGTSRILWQSALEQAPACQCLVGRDGALPEMSSSSPSSSPSHANVRVVGSDSYRPVFTKLLRSFGHWGLVVKKYVSDPYARPGTGRRSSAPVRDPELGAHRL